MSPRRYTNTVIFRRLLQELRPFAWHCAGLLLLSLLAMPFTLLQPVPLKVMVDSVLGDHELPGALAVLLPANGSRTGLAGLIVVALLFIVIALLKHLFELAFALLRTYTTEKLVLAFRAKLFRHAQGLSLSYHDAKGTADSTFRIQYDAPAIQWIAVDAIIPLIAAVVTLLAMGVVIAQIDAPLALVALAIVPILFLVSQRYSRRVKARWQEAKELESQTFGVLQEVLSAVRLVKVFAQEDREQRRYVQQARRTLREQVKLALTAGNFGFVVGMTMAVGMAAVLFLGARHVQQGHLTLGEFILVFTYLGLLYTPIQTFSKSAASLQDSLVSMERALHVLDEKPEVEEKPRALPLRRAGGRLVFDHVSFSYPDHRVALHDISFAVQPGARVGVAGTTGAGKSTLVSLILRLYDPTQGRILLDGVDLREYRVRDLRNQFAIVLQEPVLFSSSIGENIAYARPEASPAEIIAAARAANAHEFITRLPDGYQTEVGERGLALSGGERQRISLARAFLKNAAMLILDEPTSSVDTHTEGIILEAMERLMAGRTTLMIAHRLSTLEICDLRLQLEQGRLVSVSHRAA